jgi:hypothetical protein
VCVSRLHYCLLKHSIAIKHLKAKQERTAITRFSIRSIKYNNKNWQILTLPTALLLCITFYYETKSLPLFVNSPLPKAIEKIGSLYRSHPFFCWNVYLINNIRRPYSLNIKLAVNDNCSSVSLHSQHCISFKCSLSFYNLCIID